MPEWAIRLDRYLFLLINRSHAEILDGIMVMISYRYTWVPLYILLVGFIFWYFRDEWLYILVLLGLTVTFTDLLVAHGLKPLFGRLRPCLQSAFTGKIHLLGTCEGPFGMPSAHAANSFVLTHFVWLLFRRHCPFLFLIYLCPIAIGYSRIYLGVHYPGDVIAGALLGIVTSTAGFIFLSKNKNELDPLR